MWGYAPNPGLAQKEKLSLEGQRPSTYQVAEPRKNHVARCFFASSQKYLSSVASFGLRVNKETRYINNAETITIGTTGMKPKTAVPPGVRVTRISVRDVVETTPEARLADLGLTVVGRSPSDVTRMISEMNRGGVFIAMPLTENVQKGQGESGFEWTLRLSYRPRAGRPVAPATEDGARVAQVVEDATARSCLLYTSPSPRDRTRSRMPSSA